MTNWFVKAGRYQPEVIASTRVATAIKTALTDLRLSNRPEPAGRVTVLADQHGGYTVEADGRVWDEGVREPDVVDSVVRMLLRAELDADPARVHLHAGAVALDGRAAIVGGHPGSGKSTAIAALVTAGFDYLTDERVALDDGGRRVHAFPKPISLLGGSLEALASLGADIATQGVLSVGAWHVPASRIGSGCTMPSAEPATVALLHFMPGAPIRVAELHGLTAAARLVSGSPDAARIGVDGVHAIVSLCTSVPCVSVEYGDLDELVSWLRGQLTSTPPVRSAAVEVVTGSNATEPPGDLAVDKHGRFGLAENATVWLADDSGLAYLHHTGTVVELDGISSSWIQLMQPELSLDQLIAEIADETGMPSSDIESTALPVVRALAEAGLVARYHS